MCFRLAISKAFSYWSNVSALEFTEVCETCKADIKISFETYYHYDGDDHDSEPFDGNNSHKTAGVLVMMIFQGNFVL